MEDKYIGVILALAGAVANGFGFIIIKMGLTSASERDGTYAASSDDYAYLKNPTWWVGTITHGLGWLWVLRVVGSVVLAEFVNFAAYAFAPPILVTPLGSLSVIIGAILASYLLKEELGHLGRVGCALCLLGALIIVLHAPEDKEITTVDEVLQYALQPGFMMYCFSVLVFSLVMVYGVAPRYGHSNPLIYISICSLVGSVSIMAIKGFGIAVKLTFAGSNQFIYPSTYVFGVTVIGCIAVQMNYFNKALDTFSANVVNPMYSVCFTTATVIASLLLYRGFNTDDVTNIASLLTGFAVTFIGIHVLGLSQKPDKATKPSTHEEYALVDQDARHSMGSGVDDLEARRDSGEYTGHGGTSVDEEGMEVTNMVAPVRSSRG